MAVTLTSGGIQYPDGTEQTVSGKYTLVAQTLVSGNGSNGYTYTGISQHAKRVLFMVKTSFNTGPQSPVLSLTNSQGTLVNTINGSSIYINNIATGNGGAAYAATYNTTNGSNFFFAQSYATFNSLWFEFILIPDATTTRKYTYKMWSHGNPASGHYSIQGDGTFSAGVAPVTQLSLTTGASPVFSDYVASIWQA